VILPNLINFILLANVFLRVDTLHNCVGTFPEKEVGIQVLAGVALSSQTV